jgi:predicted RNA binding protein YcfA (HicA-like mRNA interferase family)
VAIDYERLRSLIPRKLISALTRDGFTPDLKTESQQTGSHRHFIHPDGRRITVKYHNSGNIFHDPKIIRRTDLIAFFPQEVFGKPCQYLVKIRLGKVNRNFIEFTTEISTRLFP